MSDLAQTRQWTGHSSGSSSSRSPSLSKSSSQQAQRLDIQGLRMIAVLAVVVNHISASALPGGFVGVDVFFVISGFLITGRLLRTALTRTTGAYFGSFYKLRFRRLIPAAATTLLLTGIVAHIVFYGERARSVTIDAMCALFFGANWRFANDGTNYFNQDQATSPVQHYWSLSVEEQFYLVWPVLVLLVGIWVAKRRPDRLLTAVRIAAVVTIAASLAWGWHQTATAPTSAYFSTFSRTWELGTGAFLATLPSPKRPVSQVWATALSWAGLVIIGYAVVATPDGDGFPVPWAIPAVLGSAVILFAGRARQPANFVLRSSPSVWVGNLSYSIYLVHFPIWIFLESLIPERTGYLYFAVAASTLAASMASYYYVEEPGRRGLDVLLPSDERERHSMGIRFLVIVTVSTVALGAIAFRLTEPPTSFTALADPGASESARTTDPSIIDPLPEVQDAIQKGLRLTSWPKLSNEDSDEMMVGCSNSASLEKACHWEPSSAKDTGKVVLLIGDSVMHSWLPMMRDAFVPNGWSVVAIPQDDCFPAIAHYADNLRGGGKIGENKFCDAQHDFFPAAFSKTKPDLVIMDNMSDAIFKVSDGNANLLPHDQQVAAYQAGLNKTIGMARQVGAKVLVLSATPDHKTIENCRVGSAGPQDCLSKPSSAWQEIRALDVQTTKESGATYADTQNFFCHLKVCPSTVGNLKVMIDNHHITQEYAEYLAPSFANYLKTAGFIAKS